MANTTGQKYGGRKSGTSNKDKTNIRAIFQLLVENNVEALQSDLDSLKPFDRVKAIIELSKFCLPTLKAIDCTNTEVEKKVEPIIFRIIGNRGDDAEPMA